MNKGLLFSFLILNASLLYSTNSLAGDSGFYLGGSLGSADVRYNEDLPDAGDIDFDDDDLGYKVFGGFNINWLEFLDTAVELSYVDFGEQDGTVADVRSELDVDAWTATVLGGIDIGPFGLFAKAGLASWDGDVSASGDSGSDDGTDPVYGVGLKFQLGSFAIRGEYEMYDLDEIDIDYFSIGASYTF